DRRAASVREGGPDAPPSGMNMAPPAPADIPENVAMPARGKIKPLQEQFQRRLAESAQQTVRPGMVDMPHPILARGGEDEPIHLVPPSSRRTVKGGGKGLAAPAPAPEPAASFQMASVDFRSGSADLTAADRASIAEVARVYKQTGGVIRVVGHAPTPVFGSDAVQQMMGGLDASMKRANAVARELSKRGVPGSKIMVGADPSVAAMGETGAQVFLDVI
ncbi:MAG: OmpA family protein, partial [Rhodospirillaceae bacterium]|nr:OmpA family protein [Rhodospirillales bacterium]